MARVSKVGIGLVVGYRGELVPRGRDEHPRGRRPAGAQRDAGGPADVAGIRGGDRIVRMGRYQVPVDGDVIIAVDGQPVTDMETWTIYLETQKIIGDTVQITILRDAQEQVITVILEE